MDSREKAEAQENLFRSIGAHTSRRALLKGAALTGVAAASAGILGHSPALAWGTSTEDSISEIFTVARTAEQLAVTFYTNGVMNAAQLGITGDSLTYLKAALIEEQIHQLFFTAAGGQSLATVFSFPHGAATFQDLATFIATQQQLEGVFDSAFLAAVREFAHYGNEHLAQISAQIAMIESEHRVLGRVIGGLSPADNWAFAPVLLNRVSDAPAVVQSAGYLSPTSGNSYAYEQINFNDPTYSAIFQQIIYQTP
jgi:hypothetical protein